MKTVNNNQKIESVKTVYEKPQAIIKNTSLYTLLL